MSDTASGASAWKVVLHDEFDAEFEVLADDVQDNLLAAANAIQIAGPKAGRMFADTKFDKHLKQLKADVRPRR